MNCKDYDDIKESLTTALAASNLTLTKAVNMMKEAYPEDSCTVQNISSKITRGTIRFIEFKRLLEMCGFQIRIVPISDNPELVEEPATHYNINEDATAFIKSHPSISYIDACQYGVVSIQSPHFQTVMIAGKNCYDAADFYKRNMEKYPDLKAHMESYLIYQMQEKYNVVAKPLLRTFNFE